MVTVTINGKEVTVEDNTLILDAARQAGFEIPTFCYQANLSRLGSCRMCLVEIEGQRKLQPSCVTPVLHGMKVNTESENVLKARSDVLEFLLSNHALDCPVCDKGGECELQDMVFRHGPHRGRHREAKYRFHEKDYVLSPVIVKNSNRCVHCMRCVRVCKEVVGVGVLGSFGRGQTQEETSFLRTELDCDHCGNCIEVCPVGCFMRRPYRYKARPWDLETAVSVCPYCSTGCRIKIQQRDGVVLRSMAERGKGFNEESLCARGRFGFDFTGSAERLTTPLVRRDGELRRAGWDEALSVIKERFRLGSRAAGIASARLTNEELYLFQKLMRGAVGTANVDSASNRWSPQAVEAFADVTGMAAGHSRVFDLLDAGTILVVGSHLSTENPVTDYKVRRYVETRDTALIVASSRSMKLDGSASFVLRHEPAAEGELLEGLAAIGGGEGRSGAVAGVDADALRGAARELFGSQTVGIIAGTEFLRCPENIRGLKGLKEALAAGGRRVLIMPVFDRPNQRGAWTLGVTPGLGPGFVSLDDGARGEDSIIEAVAAGRIDSLYVAGSDLAAAYPDGAAVRKALEKLDMLVVQDIFLTETARMAHVVLPAASFAEKCGTFTNQEGRIQRLEKLVDPPGEAKTDLEIIAAVGEMISPGFGPATAERVREEIDSEVEAYGSATADERGGLLVAGSAQGLRPADHPVVVSHVEEKVDAAFHFKLVTGNHLFFSGTLARRSPVLRGLLGEPYVEINEEDAESHGLKAGDFVKVHGKYHEVKLKVRTTRGFAPSVAYIPENFEELEINRFFRKGHMVPRVNITRV
ncbi:MAG TPA: NADH dehydrogenase (quinone) subunit G [Deltaproteobacteria bacterium]|nr:NADH dehydrogenase (quinone) subunit G [Deltaproteobacteria bacterium]